MSHAPFDASATVNQTHPPDVLPEIAAALETLANLETRYESDRESLMRWPGPEDIIDPAWMILNYAA